MTQPYTGGCACGAVRYATKHAPIFQNHCQCRDCQRRSGTGHGSYLTFPARAEMTITGEAKHWEVAGDSGNVKIHAFCPGCGTQVYLRFAAMPELIAVPAASLDEPDRFTPQVLTYSVGGPAWDAIDPSLQAFKRLALDGISGAEAAQELGLSVAAVYMAKSRVLARIRQEAEGLID